MNSSLQVRIQFACSFLHIRIFTSFTSVLWGAFSPHRSFVDAFCRVPGGCEVGLRPVDSRVLRCLLLRPLLHMGRRFGEKTASKSFWGRRLLDQAVFGDFKGYLGEKFDTVLPRFTSTGGFGN